MHHHAEIWVPERETAKEYVAALMKPFFEGDREASRPFWDWYVIGGRWSGQHTQWVLKKQFPEAFKKFWDEFGARKLRWYSRENPEAKQKALAVELFREIFPSWTGPLIVGRNSYEEDGYEDDIVDAKEIPYDFFEAATLIVPDGHVLENVEKGLTRFEPQELAEYTKDPYLLARAQREKYGSALVDLYHSSVWNGATHQYTKEDFQEEVRKRGLFLRGFFVTVDYHS